MRLMHLLFSNTYYISRFLHFICHLRILLKEVWLMIQFFSLNQWAPMAPICLPFGYEEEQDIVCNKNVRKDTDTAVV